MTDKTLADDLRERGLSHIVIKLLEDYGVGNANEIAFFNEDNFKDLRSQGLRDFQETQLKYIQKQMLPAEPETKSQEGASCMTNTGNANRNIAANTIGTLNMSGQAPDEDDASETTFIECAERQFLERLKSSLEDVEKRIKHICTEYTKLDKVPVDPHTWDQLFKIMEEKKRLKPRDVVMLQILLWKVEENVLFQLITRMADKWVQSFRMEIVFLRTNPDVKGQEKVKFHLCVTKDDFSEDKQRAWKSGIAILLLIGVEQIEIKNVKFGGSAWVTVTMPAVLSEALQKKCQDPSFQSDLNTLLVDRISFMTSLGEQTIHISGTMDTSDHEEFEHSAKEMTEQHDADLEEDAVAEDSDEKAAAKVDGARAKLFEGAATQPDEQAPVKPNEEAAAQQDGARAKPNEGAVAKIDEGARAKPDEGAVTQQDEGARAKPDEGAAAQRDGARAKPKAQTKQLKRAKAEAASVQASHKTSDKKVFQNQPSIEVLGKLGEGFQGSVYKVKDTLDEKEYAVKEVIIRKDQDPALLMEEVKALAALKRKENFGIVEYYHPWRDTTVRSSGEKANTLCYKMELCESTLGKWLDSHRNPDDRPRIKMLGVFYQMVASVAYLHHKKDNDKKGFVHRDLKPDNVLFPTEGEHEVKIGDFGLAVDKDAPIEQEHEGKPFPYAAPELNSNPELCSEKVDIFSLGIILLDLLIPFESAEKRVTALMEAREGNFSQFQRQCQAEDLELAEWLCKRKPQERPSAMEVIKNKHCQHFLEQVHSGSDVWARNGLSRLKKYADWVPDNEPDRLVLLPAHLKKKFYDGIIIHHVDEEEEAKEYRDKIQALTLKNGSHPKIALPRDLDHAGATEMRNVVHTLEVCSIVYLLVTEKFCKEKAADVQFLIDMYMVDSNMYPADDRKNFVIPVFTKTKTDLANFLSPGVKVLSGINCSRKFDGEDFLKSLTDCPYEHSRQCREERQKLQQDAHLVQKQIGELKL